MSTETEEALETGDGEDGHAGLSEDALEAPTLPDQHDFYKMPAKFGHVPVADAPLGWDPKRAFEGLYPHVRLPTQVVERVSLGSPGLAPNKLFFGDNLHVMRSLPSESVDLIYIDPPFFSQQNYNVLFGDRNEIRSFKDIWEGGLTGYLVWLNARLYEMKRLLKPTGSIFVHLDWHASHYVKVEMDKLFGYEAFRNEIIWHYKFRLMASSRIFNRKHDTILFYAKSPSASLRPVTEAWTREEIIKTRKQAIYEDENGREWIWMPGGKGHSKNKKKYLDDIIAEGKALSDVWNLPIISSSAKERIGYPTQKPEQLLERIVQAASDEGDVVADFFGGGGTTAALAQRLGRRWIACDISRVAVSITADRVAKIAEAQQGGAAKEGEPSAAVPDFEVANWGIYEIAGLSKMSDDGFREFVLHAYEARLDSTESAIHGYKVKEPIYVGPPDPDKGVRKEQVADFANAVLKRRGSGAGATMIAWAFTDAARKMAERIEAQGKVKLKFVKLRLIPIESPDFAAHISAKHERYEDLLAFVLPPSVRVRRKKLSGRRYSFDASESAVLNPGAKIINVQWDFDYRDVFTSSPGFELQRDKKGNPVLGVEFEFPRVGTFNIAVRVQDDLGGEAIFTDSLTVS